MGNVPDMWHFVTPSPEMDPDILAPNDVPVMDHTYGCFVQG
jgi:hypothetical protein